MPGLGRTSTVALTEHDPGIRDVVVEVDAGQTLERLDVASRVPSTTSAAGPGRGAVLSQPRASQ
jgi:hypothetical protein